MFVTEKKERERKRNKLYVAKSACKSFKNPSETVKLTVFKFYYISFYKVYI